ncbi:MAG: tetratricopeptide repeat protein [Flavobacteriales bacterium]
MLDLVQAQGTTDEQLAAHYYREGDFEKALLYYERLYSKSASDEYYEYYLNSLLATNDYKNAQKLTEQHAKAHPGAYRFQADIGNVLLKSGEDDKANKHFDKLIKGLDKASVNQILDLGQAFAELNMNDRALEVYYQGRKHIGSAYPFHFQIAPLLGQQGDVEGMIREYLDVLEVSNGYIQSVQNTLNRVIGFEEENKYNEVLQTELLSRVQKHPNNDIYAEMLIWMYMKQNKFESALIQVKAMDKRNKEDGERVIDLAELALSNYKYDVAIGAYSYVKAKGPGNYYYLDAMAGLLQALKAKVTNADYDQAAIAQLILEYKNTLDELGFRNTTASIILDYAHVKAFYESKFRSESVEEATILLGDALELPGLNENTEARLKTELADIYVLSNNIWDASLLYGQVEKKFKYDELGHEAKLKNALVFYYAGDFGWAQSQLLVLKGSTSKLISNDAVELSAFITENIGIDSNMEALSLFAQTELMIAQHKFDSALAQLKLIEKQFPGHDLGDNILFKRAEIYAELGQYEKAAETFMLIPEQYPFDILVDNALIEAGRIYENQLNDMEKAMAIYQMILTDHTNSLFVVEARKRFRSLRGDKVQ